MINTFFLLFLFLNDFRKNPQSSLYFLERLTSILRLYTSKGSLSSFQGAAPSATPPACMLLSQSQYVSVHKYFHNQELKYFPTV